MNRRRQPHRIPPPISHGIESLDAEIVLHEFPDDTGLLLWKTVRGVTLWGELGEGERPGAFGRDAHRLRLERLREAGIDPDVRESMETAASVLTGQPVHVEAVVTACRHIASWAAQRGALGTALEFTQAAAHLTPGDAELIHAVARLARQRGEFARAESWYRQAIAVSRRTHDWISLAGAYLGLGGTFLRRGNYASARQTLIRGVRAAERHSLREERGLLSHQLARVAMRTDRLAEATRHARAAFEAYGADHPRIPALALDLGRFWGRAGYVAEARGVLLPIPAHRLNLPDRLARSAALARAAAIAGDPVGTDDAWRETREILRDPEAAPASPEALLDLSHAAAVAGQRERAAEMAEWARRVAEGRGDTAQRSEAEALLRTLGEERLLGEPLRKASRETRRLAADLALAVGAAEDGGQALPLADAV